MIDSSKTIDFFIGLPGSGKTYAAKSLLHCLENNVKNSLGKDKQGIDNQFITYSPIIFIDDLYIQLKENNFNWQHVFGINLTIEPNNIVITDFLACDPKQQLFIYQKLKELFPQHKQNWYFFENDIEQCLKNVQARNNGKDVHITISQMNKIYSIHSSLYDMLDSLCEIPVFCPDIKNHYKKTI